MTIENESWQHLMEEGHEAYLDGYNDEASLIYKSAFALAQSSDELTGPETAKLFLLQGDLFLEQHRYTQAEIYYRDALTIFDFCSHSESIESAIALKNISEICRVQDRNIEASEYARQAQKITKKKCQQLERLYKKNITVSLDT